MKHVPLRLPPAALARHAEIRLEDLTTKLGGLWFGGRDATHSGWPARAGDATAAPNLPDEECRRFGAVRGRRALHLLPGVNGGFEAAVDLPDPGLWSAAVIWMSDATEAKSLLTLRGGGGVNYVYLSGTAGREVVLRDDAGRAEAVLPCADTPWQVTLLGCTAGSLRLARPDGRQSEAAGLEGVEDNRRLLIGCRNHRPGMKKTLGGAIIAEVLFWPGLDLLAPVPTRAARELRGALDDFALWEL